jgi:Dna[CI] antecedent, DciA
LYMRTLKELLPKKQTSQLRKNESLLDEKTVFYIARKIISEEYGQRGGENIVPVHYQEGKLFLSSRSSLWGNEVWLEREVLRNKMNTLLGQEGIQEIKITRD